MLMYSLIEYNSNYSNTTGSLLVYSFVLKDEAANLNATIANTNACKSFKYKAKLLGKAGAGENNSILIMQQLLYY